MRAPPDESESEHLRVPPASDPDRLPPRPSGDVILLRHRLAGEGTRGAGGGGLVADFRRCDRRRGSVALWPDRLAGDPARHARMACGSVAWGRKPDRGRALRDQLEDRKSTRLNSSHSQISYAVFCLKKKTK